MSSLTTTTDKNVDSTTATLPWYNPSTWLMVPKLLYFSLNLAYFSCYTFRAKYLEEVYGIKPGEYGLIAAILSLVIFLGGYFWSYLSDRYSRPKLLLLIATGLSALSFQLFLVKLDPEVVPKQSRIAYASVVSAFYLFFNSAMCPLLDTIVLKSMLGMERKDLYGRQRLWATIAYGLISVIVSSFEKKSPALNILILGLSVLFIGIGIRYLPSDQKLIEAREAHAFKKAEASVVEEGTNNQSQQCNNDNTCLGRFKKISIVRLLSNPNFSFLLLVVFANGFARAFMTHFLQPIQKSVFGSPEIASGVSTVTGVFFELIIFFYAKDLLKHLGIKKMLLISQFCMCLRIACYAFLPRPPTFKQYLPLFYELFKGLSFGFMQSAAVQLAISIAPEDLKASAQSLYHGVFSGLSACVAGLFGYLIQQFGSSSSSNTSNGATKEEIALAEQEKSIFMLQVVTYVSVLALIGFAVKYMVLDELVQRKKDRAKKESSATSSEEVKVSNSIITPTDGERLKLETAADIPMTEIKATNESD